MPPFPAYLQYTYSCCRECLPFQFHCLLCLPFQHICNTHIAVVENASLSSSIAYFAKTLHCTKCWGHSRTICTYINIAGISNLCSKWEPVESHTLDFNAIACIKDSLSGGERQLSVAGADCYLAMLARQEKLCHGDRGSCLLQEQIVTWPCWQGRKTLLCHGDRLSSKIWYGSAWVKIGAGCSRWYRHRLIILRVTKANNWLINN